MSRTVGNKHLAESSHNLNSINNMALFSAVTLDLFQGLSRWKDAETPVRPAGRKFSKTIALGKGD
ncbi:hypothetical protein [Pedobacter terrae]|uniref:hypothetical protein n=1 Tax=Pedobacter terrae TaxID=405671 RepID=UPI002FF5F71D